MATPPIVGLRERTGTVEDDAGSFASAPGTRAGSPESDAPDAGRNDDAATAATGATVGVFRSFANAVGSVLPSILRSAPAAAQAAPGAAPAAPVPTWLDGIRDLREISGVVRELLALARNLQQIVALREAALGAPAAPGAPAEPSDMRVFAETLRETLPTLAPLLDPTRLAELRIAILGEPVDPDAPPSDARVIVETLNAMLPTLAPLLDPTRLAELRIAILGEPVDPDAPPSDARVIVETLNAMLPTLAPLLDPWRLADLRAAAMGEPVDPDAPPAPPSDARVIVETLNAMLPALTPLLDPARLAALREAALGPTTSAAPAGPSDTRIIAETVREVLPLLTTLADPARLAALRTAALGDTTTASPAGPSDTRVIVEAAREMLPSLLPLLTTLSDPNQLAALRTAALGEPATTTAAATEPSDARVIAQTAASFLPFLQDAIARPERIAAAIEMIRTAALGAPADPSAAPAPASTTMSDMRSIAGTLQGVVDLTNRVLTNPAETATAIRTVMDAVSPPAAPAAAGSQPAPAGPSMLGAAVQIAGAIGNTADLVRRALDNPQGTADAASAAVAALRTGIMAAPNPDAPSMATSLRNWVVDGITGAAKSVFLEGIITALNAAIPEIEGSNPPVAAQLRRLVETVRETQRTNGDLNVLKANILQIMDGNETLSRILQIHLDNYIPISLRQLIQPPAESADDLFSRNIAALGRRPEGPAPDYRQSIATQKERVVQNVGVMAAMQIANILCRGKIDPEKFPSMIANIPHDASFITKVKERFDAELDRNVEISWYRKWIARSCFRIVTVFCDFFLARFITGLLGKLDQTLTNTTSQQTQQTHNAAIDRANDFLTILKGVLAAERDNRGPTEDYKKRVEKALAKPEFNHGWSQQSLYTAAGAKAVDAFLSPLGWHADFSRRIASLHPVFSYLLHVVAGSFVWFGELISNAFIRGVLKTILYQADVVNQLVTLSESQIVRNGYTHAVNKLIFSQLHLIWESLHEPAAPGAPQRSEATVANKQYLRQMIINFFEVLSLNQKAQFSTFDPSFIERAREGIHKMSLDLNVDVIALIVDRAKNEFLNPARLPMRVHQTLEVFNAALETETTATEEEMLQLEKDIGKLSDMLINKAVEDVIHDRFHADPNEGTTDGARFLTMIQTEVTDFTTRATALLNANQREEAVTLLSSYQNTLRDIQRRVHADPALATDGEAFNRFFGVPLAQKLAELGTLLQQNQPRETILAKVQEIKTWTDGLAPIFTVNLRMFGAPGKLFEKVAQTIAFNSGKEFWDSILTAVRTPYNWRYGAWHHGVLLPLVETKIPNQFLSLV